MAKSNKNKMAKQSFKEVVEGTSDIAQGYKPGLQALEKGHRIKIIVSDTSELGGSVAIDDETKALYPNDSRWDYVVAYKHEAYFIEVHTANTGEISAVINKLRWLKDWLVSKAPELNKLKPKDKNAFYWIQSQGFAIPPNTRQHRIAVQHKIVPVKNVNLG